MRPSRAMATVLGVALWLLSGPAAPLHAGVTAEVEPREVRLGESVLLRVLVSGDDPATVAIPDLPGFTVTPRGRAVGTRSDGNAAEPVTAHRFELAPTRTGELTVPPLAVSVGNAVVHTPEIRVRVRAQPAVPAGLGDRDTALDALVSNAAPYVGEPFLYTLRLFRSRAVSGASVAPPDFPGFTVVPLPGQRDGEVAVGGRRYAVSEMDYLLTPTRVGRTMLEAGSAACREIPRAGRASPGEALTCSGPRIAVTVRPLPPFPGPGVFSGLVGRVRLTARLEPPGLGAGAGPTLVATLTGQGNLTEVAPPSLAMADGTPLRPLPTLDEGGHGPSGYQGSRTFRYPLPAAQVHDQGPPEIGLTYFDPEKGAYATLTARPTGLPGPDQKSEDERFAESFAATDATADTSAPSWLLTAILGLAGPTAYAASRILGGIRSGRKTPARLGPTALAEALRQALADVPDGRQPAARAALDRLDRLLYSGRPVSPEALDAAILAAGQALAELAP